MLAWLRLTCGLHYRVRGLENIPNTPSVIACQHQSGWETMALQLIFPRQVWVADMNRDGLLDLTFSNSSSSNVGVYLGNGQGSFTGATGATLFGVGSTPFGVTAGDLNGDGNRDLVVADSGSSTLSVLLATELCK